MQFQWLTLNSITLFLVGGGQAIQKRMPNLSVAGDIAKLNYTLEKAQAQIKTLKKTVRSLSTEDDSSVSVTVGSGQSGCSTRSQGHIGQTDKNAIKVKRLQHQGPREVENNSRFNKPKSRKTKPLHPIDEDLDHGGRGQIKHAYFIFLEVLCAIVLYSFMTNL